MDEMKICSQCNEAKIKRLDFYFCVNQYRSECKVCTIKKNGQHQRKVKTWKKRNGEDDALKIYRRDYYAKNKEKFAKYREEFNERFPQYYKDYYRKRKETKNNG